MGPTNISEEIEIAVNRGTGDELPFYCVSTLKLSVLSLATFGLYELFWFYKNWVLVRVRSGRDISPFWRAFFSPVFCYPFASAVNSAAESVNIAPRIRPGPIAAIYAGLLLLQRLPDPYWLICLFSFVPLIPVARQIRTVHETLRPGFESAIGWGGWSYTTLAIGGIVTGLAVIGTFGPPTRALPMSEIPSSYEVTLVEAGVLEPDERIQFFYSGGIFSILEDGNLLTEKRIVSYETVDGELFVASSTYPEIREFDVEYSENFLDDTVITISTLSGDDFILIVSAEDGRDKEFVSDLESRLPASRRP
jgi:hypothetical protein